MNKSKLFIELDGIPINCDNDFSLTLRTEYLKTYHPNTYQYNKGLNGNIENLLFSPEYQIDDNTKISFTVFDLPNEETSCNYEYLINNYSCYIIHGIKLLGFYKGRGEYSGGFIAESYVYLDQPTLPIKSQCQLCQFFLKQMVGK